MVQVPAHTRRKKSVKEQLPEEIPVVERHHYVDEAGRTCPHCSAKMVEIGTETRETLGMAPAKILVIRDIAHTYACKECVEHYLKYIYDKLHQELLKETILHADETELQVLREEGKSPQSKS